MSWKHSKATKRCNVFPTVWAAIYGCKGEQTHTWRYTIGHFGRRVPEYACPTCQAAADKTDATKGLAGRAEYQRLLREAQDAAGVKDYRTANVRIVAGVPTVDSLTLRRLMNGK